MKIQAKDLVAGQSFSVPTRWGSNLPPVTYTAVTVTHVMDNGSPVVAVLVDTTTPFVSSQYAWFAPTSTLDVA